MAERKKGKSKAIVLSTALCIFSLLSTFSGTVAWFLSQRTVSVEAGSFSISAPPGIEFNLYYLKYFGTPKTSDGNLNTTLHEFSGYEIDQSDAVFEKVDEYTPSATENPRSINKLWPAHKLTYAIAITSGDVGKLSLTAITSTVSSKIFAISTDDEENQYQSAVSLLWAIRIKGACYNVDGDGIGAAVNSGFDSYRLASIDPGFSPSEGEMVTPPFQIVDAANPSGSGQYTIFYLTIEFSNDESTFYSPIDSDLVSDPVASKEYVMQNDSGNSNCYEGLTVSGMVFTLE